MNIVLWFRSLYRHQSYRTPMMVTQMRIFSGQNTIGYYICPRCHVTMDREFMAYCDRCGQCLDWREYEKAVIIHDVK